MPLKLKQTKEGIISIELDPTKPYIYLDTWTFNDFITNENKGKEFSNIINRLHGTLTISLINILEIIRDDIKQIQSICKFIDSVDYVYIENNPTEVMKKEEELKKQRKSIDQANPWLERDFLQIHSLNLNNSIKLSEPYSIFEMVSIVKKNISIENGKNTLPVLKKEFFEKCRESPFYMGNARKRYDNIKKNLNEYSPLTQAVFSLCIDHIIKNKNKKMWNINWYDIFHLIVPIVYCDYVTLDKEWYDFIKTSGLSYCEIAHFYDKRHFKVFFNELATFKE